jgi:hypothetical protein
MNLINPKDEKSSLIIDITDIYEHKKRKEEELQFYKKELDKLMARLELVQREIGVTETIITLIEKEQIVDLTEAIKEKKKLK